MANQLYAVPIIIEAFQTGKAALQTDQEIQSLNSPPQSPNNGHWKRFYCWRTVCLDKGILLIGRKRIRVYSGDALK
jgi:hypothetical protein